MTNYPWLPPLVKIEDYDGDVFRYYEALYQFYCQDLVFNPPAFEGVTVRTLTEPWKDGKEAGFWHILEGGKEGDLPNELWRHERIGWVRAVIEAAGSNRVCVWKVPWQRKLVRPHIALPDFSYLVVLEQHAKFVKLITGFPIERQKWRDKKRKEWIRLRGMS
jgi:hypothetical protein